MCRRGVLSMNSNKILYCAGKVLEFLFMRESMCEKYLLWVESD